MNAREAKQIANEKSIENTAIITEIINERMLPRILVKIEEHAREGDFSIFLDLRNIFVLNNKDQLEASGLLVSKLKELGYSARTSKFDNNTIICLIISWVD